MIKRSESLIRGTDAIPSGSIEWNTHKGKDLIRYRRPTGTTGQHSAKDKAEAWEYFQKRIQDLREQILTKELR